MALSDLEAAKRASVAQLLMKGARLLNEQALVLAREQMGMPGLRPAHTSLLPHIDLEGTRLTEIARRLGVSKQAVGQLVAELEAMGGLERVPDPADGRAKLVRFVGGGAGLLQGLRVLGEVEAELRVRLGDARIDALAETMGLLVDELEARPLA